MSKTFILAGGNDRKSPDYGLRLSQEIAKHVTNPKILSCFYSWPEESWEQKAEDWQSWFSNNFNWPFTYDYARADSLLEQMDAADVIYFHGGDTNLLFEHLPPVEKLKKHFQDKVIIGSSAGANMLSKYFWSSKRAAFGEGLGILDINIMVHYGAPDHEGFKRTPEDWQREEAEFQEHIGGRTITHLPEGQFVIIEQDIK
ncbi:MAG TPA: Type 1 glutamine amidotransferase-like domain-containing protein [Candidatus Saccharimonadales bacterium]|nr:Type 1 glutamine amidotransferase-like domain-containing protein [Candidatus Saccharimonadales bacterium]